MQMERGMLTRASWQGRERERERARGRHRDVRKGNRFKCITGKEYGK